MNLPERIERVVRAWPHWSPAERRRMDQIVAEVLDHCRSGSGNAFVASWCERNVRLKPCPACGHLCDPTYIPPPRVPLDIRCACCCQ